MNPIHEVYFDCAASAPVLPCALEAMTVWPYANPNSVHSRGRDARGDLENARATVAKCIGAEPNEIFFAPSATAACKAVVDLLEIRHCSDHEHKAVRDACTSIFHIICHDDNAYAHILASNETGQIFLEDIKALVARGKTVFTDATAAMGHIPIAVKALGVAALAAGGHKFGAPPGIGFLYVKGGVAEYEITERDFSYPGTPPVALAVALAEALEYRTSRMADASANMLAQQSMLSSALLNNPGAHINCEDKPRLPNILSVRFDGVNARELLTLLDVNGVCASAGSACHAEDDRPSAALLAAGLTEEQARSTIRLSWCEETPASDFPHLCEILSDCVNRLRSISGHSNPQ